MKIKNLLLGLFLLLSVHAMSQRLGGGEVYYQLIGDKKYLVTAVVYRTCEWASLDSLPGLALSGKLRVPLRFKRQSISRINDTCGNPCANRNQISNAGFEKHTYTDTVDLLSGRYNKLLSSGSCEVRFAIANNYRVGMMNTFNVSFGRFYVEAMVNVCLNLKTNHSPIFSMEPKFLHGLNQTLYYTPGPLDTFDLDSLSFTLEPIQQTDTTLAVYKSPYNSLLPMTPYCPPNPGVVNCRALPSAKPARGFYFDPSSCQIVVTPTAVEQTAVRIKVGEWRRDSTGVMRNIGYINRDMMVRFVQGYMNMNPVITSYQSSASELCNQSYSRSITFSDDKASPLQTVNDTLTVVYNNGLPGSRFYLTDSNSRLRPALISWQNNTNRSGQYNFAVQVRDVQCNIGMNTYAFNLYNNIGPDYTPNTKLGSCNVIRGNIVQNDPKDTLVGYIQVKDLNKSQNVYFTYNLNDSIIVNSNGTYSVTYYVRNPKLSNCYHQKSDTVVVKNSLSPVFVNKYTDTSVCVPYNMALGFSPAKMLRPVTWEWSLNDTVLTSSDSFLNRNISKLSAVRLLIKDGQGCFSNNYQRFVPVVSGKLLYDTLSSFCPGSEVVVYGASYSNLTSYRWEGPGIDSVTPIRKLIYKPNASGYLKLTVTDKNQCQFTDSLKLQMLGLKPLEIIPDPVNFCRDSVINLTVRYDNSTRLDPLNSLLWRINGKDSFIGIKGTIAYKMYKDLDFEVRIVDGNTCVDSVSYSARPLLNPSVKLMASQSSVCHLDTVVLTANAQNHNRTGIEWLKNGVPLKDTGETIEVSIDAKATYGVRVNNGGVCYAKDQTIVNQFPVTNVRILGNTLYRFEDTVRLNSDKIAQSYQWSTGQNSRQIAMPAKDFGPPGSYTVSLTIVDQNNCKANAQTTILTNKTGLESQDRASFTIYPNPFTHTLELVSEQVSEMKIYNAQGVCVRVVQLQAGLNRLDLSDLEIGLYVLEKGAARTRVCKM